MGGGRPPVARGARGGMGLLVRVFGGLAVGGLLAHAVLRRWEGTSAAADEVTGGETERLRDRRRAIQRKRYREREREKRRQRERHG